MFKKFKKAWRKKQLKNMEYEFLFAEEPENEYVCFDLETTSLNANSAEILSIGAVKIRDHRVLTSQKLYLEIKSDGDFCQDAIKVHRIRKKDARTGLSVEEGLRQLLYFIGSRPIVGYYLEFDIAVVNRYLRHWLGTSLPNRQIEVSAEYYDWKTRGSIDHYVDLKFATIMETLDIPTLSAHNSYNDALMAAMCFVKLQHQTTSAWRRSQNIL